MDRGLTPLSRPRRSRSAGATFAPETPEQRAARRKAWGHEWGAVMHKHSQQIKAREGR